MILDSMMFWAVTIGLPAIVFIITFTIFSKTKEKGKFAKAIGGGLFMISMLVCVGGAGVAYQMSTPIIIVKSCEEYSKSYKLPIGDEEIEYDNFGSFDQAWLIVQNQTDVPLRISEDLFLKYPQQAEQYAGRTLLNHKIPKNASHGFDIADEHVFVLEPTPDEMTISDGNAFVSAYSIRCAK